MIGQGKEPWMGTHRRERRCLMGWAREGSEQRFGWERRYLFSERKDEGKTVI